MAIFVDNITGKIIASPPGFTGIATDSACCCGCDDPELDVTLTWTDADVTKSFLGLTWTNGETKSICPTFYGCVPSAGYTQEAWGHQGDDYDTFILRASAQTFPPNFRGSAKIIYKPGATTTYKLSIRKGTAIGTVSNTSGVSSQWKVATTVPSSAPLANSMFSTAGAGDAFVTFTNGLTISWTRTPAEWNTCSIP